jgi:hypothetical protein
MPDTSPKAFHAKPAERGDISPEQKRIFTDYLAELKRGLRN